MSESRPRKQDEIVVRNGPPIHPVRGRSSGAYEGLWFTLSRVAWRSIAVVPVDPDGSAVELAVQLAAVGRRLRPGLLTFLLMTGPLDYPSAGKFVSAVAARTDGPSESPGTEVPRVVVSTPSVLAEPLALAVVSAVDAVVLCMTKGKTSFAAAERAIQLIGRERVIGSLLQ